MWCETLETSAVCCNANNPCTFISDTSDRVATISKTEIAFVVGMSFKRQDTMKTAVIRTQGIKINNKHLVLTAGWWRLILKDRKAKLDNG